MGARTNRSSKLVNVLEKRLGRTLSDQEAFQLATYARTIRMYRGKEQRIYKPRMELCDDGQSERLTALFEVPGLHSRELRIDVVDGRLIVSGERRPRAVGELLQQGEEAGGELAVARRQDVVRGGSPSQVRELKYGFFRRAIALPEGCMAKDLDATMENGMLAVSWPRFPMARLFVESTNDQKHNHGDARGTEDTEDFTEEEEEEERKTASV
ncbi:uncharacterized protein BXZ73DRAFT_99996 [Epithele typhae]|uniref:uncharacterized protein n=1 Tax=Epithele typhae TaxID=378194 RepID=UPI00200729D6|nr:uncharacterized protein BXZ73DRAFT_99996 [Epithele typhae]KAH9937775.1 hypothetical protein BXZ73DRAFT_99996 [Epithele typhae]